MGSSPTARTRSKVVLGTDSPVPGSLAGCSGTSPVGLFEVLSPLCWVRKSKSTVQTDLVELVAGDDRGHVMQADGQLLQRWVFVVDDLE